MHDGKVRSLPSVMHIPGLARNLIFVSKIIDANVDFNCYKNSCNMVHGSMVLVWGVQAGTLYKLLGSTITNECNNSFILETKVDWTNKSTLWHQRLGHIGEKDCVLYTWNVWLKKFLIFQWVLISMSITFISTRIYEFSIWHHKI